MKNEIRPVTSWKNLFLRLVLVLALLSGSTAVWMQTSQAQSSTVVTLAPTAAPAAAQPGMAGTAGPGAYARQSCGIRWRKRPNEARTGRAVSCRPPRSGRFAKPNLSGAS